MAEAQYIADMYFTVCPTNPIKIQKRKERKEEAQHRRQLEQEELKGKKQNLMWLQSEKLWRPPPHTTLCPWSPWWASSGNGRLPRRPRCRRQTGSATTPKCITTAESKEAKGGAV